MKRLVTIADAMTKTTHGISSEEKIARAKERMEKFKIRHLPVRTGGRVIGILSERDLDLIFALPEFDPSSSKVINFMTPDPYMIPPETPLATAAHEMAERRIGSALVVDEEQRLLGIFTDTDSLRLLAELLDKRVSKAIKEKGSQMDPQRPEHGRL